MSTPSHQEILQAMIARYRSGEASPEEAAFLDRYYELFDRLPGMTEFMDDSALAALETGLLARIHAGLGVGMDAGMKFGMDATMDAGLEVGMDAEIDAGRASAGGGRLRRMRILWRVAAAAAVLIVALLGVLWWSVRRESGGQPVGVVPDVAAPVSNKAVLTLAGGQRIMLDSVGTGNFAAQGATQIARTMNGNIVYEGNDSNGPATVQYNTLTVPRGSKPAGLVLLDGTKVWLNAGSSLRFPVVFSGEERRITMSGEAYVEVARDSRRPFYVDRMGQDAHVAVLGTSFNMNAYEDEPAIRVTLLEGAVRVNAAGRSLQLAPGQQAVVAGAGVIELEPHASLAAVMAWKNGQFRFERTEVSSIMRQVSRWYDVDIRYADDVSKKHFTGNIERKANVSEVLHMLELTGVMHFSIEGRVIIIRR